MQNAAACHGKIRPWMQRKPSRTVSTRCCRKRNVRVAAITPAVPTPKRLRQERRTSTVVHLAVRKPSSRLRHSLAAPLGLSMPRAAHMVHRPLPASMRRPASAAHCASPRARSTQSSAQPSKCMRCCHRFVPVASFAFRPALSIASPSSPPIANGRSGMPLRRANASLHAIAGSRAANGSHTARAQIGRRVTSTHAPVGRPGSQRLLRALGHAGQQRNPNRNDGDSYGANLDNFCTLVAARYNFDAARRRPRLL
jgi:hypothetical protein